MLRPPSLKDFRPDRHRSTNRNANRLERANGDPDNIYLGALQFLINLWQNVKQSLVKIIHTVSDLIKNRRLTVTKLVGLP